MRRRTMLTGVWLLATFAATLIAWAAVRQVTAEVSPSRTLPFPSGVALAESVTEPAPAERSPAPPPDDAPGTSAPDRPDPTGAAGAPAAPAVPDVTAVTEAYSLSGGVVTVRYRGAITTLLSATPNSGFGVEIREAGPQKVDVRFRSEDHESRLVTRMREGAPDPQREERPR